MIKYFPEPVVDNPLDIKPYINDNQKIGILLINLGTPDQPQASSIRRYLREFLSDPRVIEIPKLVWQPILNLFILTRRPKKLAPLYKQIWLERGSPLLVYTQDQAHGLQVKMDQNGINARVELAMRYGNPSIESAMEKLKDCERILIVPMYPQYAASTTATAIDMVNRYTARRRNQPEVRYIKRFHYDAGYIGAMVEQIKSFWDKNGVPERLLLSYHGLPLDVVKKGDPYYQDCIQTTMLIQQALGEYGDLVYSSFQSRFGAQEWIQPYTEPTLRQWAKQGVKNVHVMCPGFLADCLETLEEIQIECRDAFIEDGGTDFSYIPCLNGQDNWIQALSDLVTKNLADWR